MLNTLLRIPKVLGAGLEPARPQWSLDFKSNVSTNSTTRAGLKKLSERRDLNPRPSPWQGDALPLSYFRIVECKCKIKSKYDLIF